jgi:hypothetical protein
MAWQGCSLKMFNQRINYVAGELIGKNGVRYLAEAEPSRWISSSGRTRIARKAVFLCPYCLGEFESQIQAVKNGCTQSCGCFARAAWAANLRDQKHRSKRDTGEKWIHFYGAARYSVTVALRKSVYLGVYKTLEDAKFARDNYLRENNQQVVGVGRVAPQEYRGKKEVDPHERKVYSKGDLIGDNGMVYLAEEPPDYCENSNGEKITQRKALFLCQCGKKTQARIGAVKTGVITSCGCIKELRRHDPKPSIPVASTGHRYVYAARYKNKEVYRVAICDKAMSIPIGTFDTIEDALVARDEFLLSGNSNKKVYASSASSIASSSIS